MRLHINRPHADHTIKLWCPYCDVVVAFEIQFYYGDSWCTKCRRRFPPNFWPKGLDIETGELLPTKGAGNAR